MEFRHPGFGVGRFLGLAYDHFRLRVFTRKPPPVDFNRFSTPNRVQPSVPQPRALNILNPNTLSPEPQT